MKHINQEIIKYIDALLPHEIIVLKNKVNKKDELNKLLIYKISDYILENKPLNFDVTIDKRKYSNLKKWMQQTLLKEDVDISYQYFLKLEEQIHTDTITAAEEKWIFSVIKSHYFDSFNFIKWYELMLKFMHYLLIRLRYDDYDKVEKFIKLHKLKYDKCIAVTTLLAESSIDIVKHYAGKINDSNKWEQQLIAILYDDEIDGYQRYMSLVRLTFMYSNYNNFKNLQAHYEYIDELFSRQKLHFSKRFLLNFYANRSLIYVRQKEFAKAEYYAKLSVKIPHNDHLLYLNNVSSILIKRQKNSEALQVMTAALPLLPKTNNFHNKFSFIAFYINCLIIEKQYKKAEQYAEGMLSAFGKEIIKYRWHLFFTTYLEALFRQKEYDKIIIVINKYKLLQLEKKQQTRAGYMPTIPLFYLVAAFQEANISKTKFLKEYNSIKTTAHSKPKLLEIFDLIDKQIL